MKKILPFGLIILLVSCVGMQPGPSVCTMDGADKSYICQVCDDNGWVVEDIDLILRITTARLGDKSKAVVLDFLDEVEGLLVRNITYRAVLELTNGTLTGPEAELISERLSVFDSTRFISSFDKMLVLKHIERQRSLLQ